MTIPKSKVLGYRVDIANLEEAFNVVKSALSYDRGLHVVTINPEMIIQAQKNPELSQSISSSDLNIPDAFGIMLALWFQGIKISNTTPGIELSEKCIKYCSQNNIPVAFFGSKDETLKLMQQKILEKYPQLNISYSKNGFFPDSEAGIIAEEIRNSGARLILVALGVPKQELWINKYKNLFPQSILIGVGGSFDVWSGNFKRAPKLFRIAKLEWFYRLITEPSRAKRIFSSLPYFVLQLLFYKDKS